MSDSSDTPLLPLDSDAVDPSELSPAMQQCALNLYRQAWTAYRQIGCPYGESDQAMFVWYALYGESDGPDLVSGKN
jgi:hypothetical protein